MLKQTKWSLPSLSFFSTLAIASLSFTWAWAAEGEALPPREQGLWQTLIMLGIAVVFFYLILWRPEQKRRKAQDEVRSALKKGDKVVAAMGIIGTIHRITDRTVFIKMSDGGAIIEVVKGAITEVVPDESAADKEDKIKKIETSSSNPS